MFYPTPKQMKQIEAYSDAHGVSYEALMESAGAAAAEQIFRLAMERDISDGVLVFCGKGNNGGDGFVIARCLAEAGIKVSVVLADGEPATGLAAKKYCELGGCDVMSLTDNIDEAFRLFSSCAVIVDAVYGTGFHGELPPAIKACFSYADRCSAVKLAVDVPSGGNCLTGETAENTLKCDCTVTFGYKKIGMLSEPLKSLCGDIVIADIGFTEDCCRSTGYVAEDFTFDNALSLTPTRPENSYKNMFGRLLNIAGSRCMSGAAALSTLAALRSGAGLVTAASTEEVLDRISVAFPEATLLPLKAAPDGTISADNADNLTEFAEKCTAVSIGCGLAVSEDTVKIVFELVKNVKCALIIDADGINCLCSCIDIIRNTKSRLIITPHLGELRRLYKAVYGESAEADRLTMAVSLARELNITVAAKGVPNYIAGDGRLYICKAGNPGLSRGGSGDVLTGIVASLAAQGLAPIEAAAAGVQFHGKAADLAAEKLSVQGMLPSDVIAQLPYVFR